MMKYIMSPAAVLLLLLLLLQDSVITRTRVVIRYKQAQLAKKEGRNLEEQNNQNQFRIIKWGLDNHKYYYNGLLINIYC